MPDQTNTLTPVALSHSPQRGPSVTAVPDGVAGDSEGDRIHTLFEAQVRRTPDAIAVVSEGQTMTYAELNRQANQLAHYLRREWAIGPDDLVGIMVTRSPRMVVGMLGVLKAGAGYVPMDAKYPKSVIDDMVDDAGVKGVLVDSDLLTTVAGYQGEVFITDVELRALTESATDPDILGTSSSAAYVIYTSGSTGRRKGVVVEHHSIINTLRWRRDYFAFDESEVTAQVPSYAFDSSVLDIFSILISGGRLVLLNEDLRTNLRYLRQLIMDHGVTTMVVTPTFYRLLLGNLHGVTSLKTVTIAGEAVDEQIVEEHYRLLPHTRLINEYGPTENSVCATACDLRAGDSGVPVGKPIWDVAVYVVDEALRLVPDGTAGEIVLGGRGIARGYLNRSELTGERFVPDPFSNEPGRRLYRTGDLGRYGPAGQLYFLGRIDHQVKVRGFRIELGEIEHKLITHPGVDSAAVVCSEGTDGEKRIVAYVVPVGDLNLADLKDYLARMMPAFMVPDLFVPIAAMPMNVSNKVDRAALPDPNSVQASRNGDTAPRNAIEERLAAIWTRILKVERVGVHDDFFELGGNSLKAVQFLADVHRDFGVDLALPDVFSSPTIDAFSAKVATSTKQPPDGVPHA